MPDPAHTNRLAAETSPYLLQHAHNPVDWYPWGPEAFAVARRENKPIFLSVGYSTCYWCHVMERQSFENEAIAAEMNLRFVNIKVDREERPDVDQLYMTAVQIMTRQGGWPMSVFLTPDLRPFYGGTYFPPSDSYGRPGFPRLLGMLEDAWKNRRGEVDRSADQLVGILRQLARPARASEPVTLDVTWISEMIHRGAADFDSTNGGFGPAPKFPRQTLLELLLTYLREANDPKLMHQVRFTLDAMARGGIRDHLGGAFHRYSTDEFWLVPHFEIMLYDNAMLLWIYVEAYRQTEDLRYAAVARGIADFVLREMTSPQGAFYTALDAEVDAAEGASYLWTRDQVVEALKPHATEQEISRFCRIYGLDAGPNFADPHQGHAAPDKNVLHLIDDPANDDSALLDENLHRLREFLYAARRLRKQPLLDTKILTSWNALMIRGLAYASQILKEPRYLDAASKAANHLLRQHSDSDGGLLRVGSDGPDGSSAKSPAFLDDYAFLIQALLALEEAGDDEERREQAQEYMILMENRFNDPQTGAMFYSIDGASDLIVRQMVGSDSPLPSGNGIAAQLMLSLNRHEHTARILSDFAGQLESVGEGMSSLIQAAMLHVRQFGSIHVAAGAVEAADRPLSPQELSARVISIEPQWSDPRHLILHCTVLQGFHVNAGSAGPNLIATKLTLPGIPTDRISSVDYPPGESRQFAFDEQPLSIYHGRFDISVHFNQPPPSRSALELALTYQPCDDSSCLPPTTRAFSVSVP